MKFALSISSLLLAGACSHAAAVSVAPAINIYSGYANEITGKYGLYIDDTIFAANAKKGSFECSGHKFPVDARAAFKESVIQTVENVFEDVEVLDEPLKGVKIAARGLKGVVVVEGTLFRPKLDVDQNFWSADAEGSVDVGILAEIYSPTERVFTSRVGATGRGEKDVGSFCGGGGKALAGAAELAIQEALERTAERMANSTELRK